MIFVVFYGSVSILVIFWMYIVMMGFQGLIKVMEVVIFSVNYMVKWLENYYFILFRGNNELVVYECIFDLCFLKK